MPRRIPPARPALAPCLARRPADKAERDRFYTGAAWRRCRAAFLAANPLCLDCEAEGRLTEATIPHHARERLQRPDLALDWDNLVPLCSPCHTRRHKASAAPRG